LHDRLILMPPRAGISNFFESLGAPLKNVRWSWGAERRDGAVFLRGWEDHRFTDASGEYVVVAHSTELGAGASPGWRERWQHIQRIAAGAPSFVVMCIPSRTGPGIIGVRRSSRSVAALVIAVNGTFEHALRGERSASLPSSTTRGRLREDFRMQPRGVKNPYGSY
jgi:hypothetical protein